jgi:RND family efflux transporter MFP subunit
LVVDALLQIGVQNACWALALALAAALGARVLRRWPAITHTLWLLVLLKLLTPSLAGISLKELSPRTVETLARYALRMTGERAPHPPFEHPLLDGASALKIASAARIDRARGAEDAVATRSPQGRSLADQNAPLAVGQAKGERLGEGANLPVPTTQFLVWNSFPWKQVAIGLWLVGALACWSTVALGARRFRRLLGCIREAPADLKTRVTAVAGCLGLKHVPETAIVPARVGPMVWAGMTGRPRLLLPEELWACLDSTQQDAVLTHELAHLKRRDHWVRRIETVVLGLYWWFPVAWWTRRELERTEEACCDAWVLRAMPDEAAAYADALVATAAFLSGHGHRQMFAPGAIGACRTLAIQRRLNMILGAASAHSLAGNSPRRLLMLGVLSLPLLPGLASSRAPAAAPQDAPAAATAAYQNGGVPGQVEQKVAKERTPDPKKVAAPANVSGLPTVRVCRATEEEVSAQTTVTGTLEPAMTVDLRARVSGYILSVNFHPGDTVKPGDLLFRIDSRSYQAVLDKAAAEVQRAEAHFRRRSLMTANTKKLNEEQRVVSQQEVALFQGEEDEAKAELQAAKAALNLAQLNLEYTNVRAPIAGKISNPYVSQGGVALADQTDLARIMSTDSLYVSFAVNENLYSKLARLKREGKMKAGIEAGVPVHVQVVGETKTFRNGKIQFVEGRVTPIGIACRAKVSNSDGLLLPGMSAGVTLQSGPTHRAILLPRYLQAHKMGDRVFVLTPQNVVERRDVWVEFARDGVFAVARGIKDGELVVLDTAHVKAGQQVVPQLVEWERFDSPFKSDAPPQ